MRFILSWKTLTFTFVTFIGLLPTSVLGQEAHGKFTLPRQVRWGDLLLAPGDYTYTVEHHTGQTVMLRSASGSSGAIVMASSVSGGAVTGDGQLVLERQGEAWFVRSLALGESDEVLYFTPPKLEPTKFIRTPRPGQ